MLPYHAFQKFLDLMIWIYLSTTCHKYKENCITSSQTTHKNPGDARFSKFSSSENRVSHDLNNRKTKKKSHQHLTACSQPSNPSKNQVEPCGMMGSTRKVSRFPFFSTGRRDPTKNIAYTQTLRHSVSGQPKSWQD